MTHPIITLLATLIVLGIFYGCGYLHGRVKRTPDTFEPCDPEIETYLDRAKTAFCISKIRFDKL